MAFTIVCTGAQAEIITAKCGEMVICPMVYEPTTCSYKKIKVTASNSCFALGELKEALCAEKGTSTIKMDSKLVKCK